MTREFWDSEELDRRVADSEYRRRGPQVHSGPAHDWRRVAAESAAYLRSLQDHTLPEGVDPIGKDGFTCSCGRHLPPVEDAGGRIFNENLLSRHREEMKAAAINEELGKEQ